MKSVTFADAPKAFVTWKKASNTKYFSKKLGFNIFKYCIYYK